MVNGPLAVPSAASAEAESSRLWIEGKEGAKANKQELYV